MVRIKAGIASRGQSFPLGSERLLCIWGLVILETEP